jgi:hypothetical protein
VTDAKSEGAKRRLPEENARWRSLQDRFERTRVGRVLISIFVLVTLVTVLTANMPTSRLQDVLLKANRLYLYGAGLDQSWEVFAPDPRRETIEVSARVDFADGSQATWRVPTRNPVIGEYTDYRWLKWAEYVISPAYPELWRPIALYVARRFDSATRRPTRVTLSNRWYDLEPPDHISPQPRFQERTIYETRITDAMLGGS